MTLLSGEDIGGVEGAIKVIWLNGNETGGVGGGIAGVVIGEIPPFPKALRAACIAAEDVENSLMVEGALESGGGGGGVDLDGGSLGAGMGGGGGAEGGKGALAGGGAGTDPDGFLAKIGGGGGFRGGGARGGVVFTVIGIGRRGASELGL